MSGGEATSLQADQWDAPTVVVGMGGSGTRVVASALQASGVYLGSRLNVALDDLAIADFTYRWTPPFLAAREELGVLDEAAMVEEHEACMASHRSGIDTPGQPWGWKCCPSAHLLPFLESRLPAMRVVHVVRDGRDMAFAQMGGRAHVLNLGRAVLDGDSRSVDRRAVGPGRLTAQGAPEGTPQRQAALWVATTLAVDRWAASAPDRIRLVRFEDLVADPSAAVRAIVAFAGGDASHLGLESVERSITPQASTGRWHDMEPATVEPLMGILADQLLRYGYLE